MYVTLTLFSRVDCTVDPQVKYEERLSECYCRGQVRLEVTTPPLHTGQWPTSRSQCHHKLVSPAQLSHFNIFTYSVVVCAVQRIVIRCVVWCVVCGVYNSIRQDRRPREGR